MMCAHLHCVGQRRVQHGEHGQVSAEVRHHATAEVLRTPIEKRVYMLAAQMMKMLFFQNDLFKR